MVKAAARHVFVGGLTMLWLCAAPWVIAYALVTSKRRRR